MGRQSVVLLSSQSPTVVFVGEPVRVDSWYSDPNHQHTVAVVAANFRGRLSIEATLKAKPTEADWFPVRLGSNFYVDYPRQGYGAETSTRSYGFTGRFVWIRARVDRTLFLPLDANELMVANCGFIDRILLNI